MKRNFRLYTIYFISMLVGAVIYFTFSGLMLNEDVVVAIQNKENYKTVIFIATIIVFVFIVFFILNANSFFIVLYILNSYMKRQKSENTTQFYEELVLATKK